MGGDIIRRSFGPLPRMTIPPINVHSFEDCQQRPANSHFAGFVQLTLIYLPSTYKTTYLPLSALLFLFSFTSTKTSPSLSNTEKTNSSIPLNSHPTKPPPQTFPPIANSNNNNGLHLFSTTSLLRPLLHRPRLRLRPRSKVLLRQTGSWRVQLREGGY